MPSHHRSRFQETKTVAVADSFPGTGFSEDPFFADFSHDPFFRDSFFTDFSHDPFFRPDCTLFGGHAIANTHRRSCVVKDKPRHQKATRPAAQVKGLAAQAVKNSAALAVKVPAVASRSTVSAKEHAARATKETRAAAPKTARHVSMFSCSNPPTQFTRQAWLDVRNWLFKAGSPFSDASKGDSRFYLHLAAKKMKLVEDNYAEQGLTVMPGQARLFAEATVQFLIVQFGLPTKIAKGTLGEQITALEQKPGVSRSVIFSLRALKGYGNRAAHAPKLGNPGQPLRTDEKPAVADNVFSVAAYLREYHRKHGGNSVPAGQLAPRTAPPRSMKAEGRGH